MIKQSSSTSQPEANLLDNLSYVHNVQDMETRFALNFDLLSDTKQPNVFVDYVMSCVVNDIVLLRKAEI